MSIEILECVQQLYDILNFPQTSIAYFQLFKRELGFLHTFLSLQRLTDEPNNSFLLDVAQKVQALLLDDAVKFSELYLTEQFDFYISEVLNQLWLTKMEIRSRYSFPKITLLPTSSKVVTEFIPSVLQNLSNVPKIGYDPCSLLYLPETILKHIEDVSKELKLLQNFVSFVSGRFNIESQISQHHGFVTAFFTHVLAVAGHASMLIWLYYPDLATEEVNVLLSDFLEMRIKPIQPCTRMIYVDVLQSLRLSKLGGWYSAIQNEDAVKTEASFLETILQNLVELPSKSNSSERLALKDHLVILQGMLNLLRPDIIHVPIQDLELLLQDIEIVVIDAGLLVYSLYEGEEEEKEGIVPAAQVLVLSNNIQGTNTQIYLTIRKAFQSNLPRIHGLGYVDFVLNNLKEFQRRNPDSLASITYQLQMTQKELESLQPFLKAVAEERHNELNNIQLCATQLIGKAYEVEYLVDACIRKEAPVWCLERWLLDILKEITLIKDEVAMIHEMKMVGDAMNTVTAHTSSILARSPRMNEEIVGFKDVIEKLRNQLIRGTKGRDIISIVGMPGLGKTTLAYRLYYDRSVVSHFDIRAQCCVSQVYSRKDLLLAILRDVVGEDSKHRENQADELADDLRKALYSKRYLILVDDVWEASAWDDLIGCFRDANIGSRIILTTRNLDVANHARFQSDPLQLRMFHDDESWELLQKKVLGEESCPPLLKNIGRQIAEKCGQLPLSVTLVAGILAGVEKNEECWQQLANNLGPHIHQDSRTIIEQSYRVLPYHLRSCFLYFGAFLEDRVIDVSKLTRLWISEGFIKSCEGKSLEDIAVGYLHNLCGRNLVMGTKKSSGGMTKACYIHDLLHDFCKERAKEENILLYVKRDENANPSSRVYYRKQLAHRMCIYGEGHCIREWSSCWSHVGSVILHDDLDGFGIGPIAYICQSFKFLKVLDLEFTTIGSFPTNLVYLRYFAARTRSWPIASSIHNLSNLETLILDYYPPGMERYNVPPEMSLPITLWNVVKLRHLHISSCRFTIENVEAFENPRKLYDLRTLSTAYFHSVRDAELVFRKTPNLEKLECYIKGTRFPKTYNLNFPTRTASLKIYPLWDDHFNCISFCISAPNLKFLTLYDFRLGSQHLSTIALLQKLQVLKLQGIHIVDTAWKVGDGEFPLLKVLKLEALVSFYKWTVADNAFANLERLLLRRCYNLKDIPSCFGDFGSLKYIEVDCCNKFVDKSAMYIRETQVEDYQNSGFELLIIHEEEKKNADSVNDDGGGGETSDRGEEKENEEEVGRLEKVARMGRKYFSLIKEYFLSTNQVLLYAITFRLLG